MSTFRDYQYSLTDVTAICVDTTNSNYVWIAFAQNSNSVCLLKKVSAYDLSQVYYTVSVPVTSINSMTVTNGNIFLAVTHVTIFAISYSVTNPLTTFTTINYPSGVVESPIQVLANGTNVYFLTPGLGSNDSKIVIATNALVFSSTVSLMESGMNFHSATTFTVNPATGDFWVAANTTPVKLLRVFQNYDASWNFAVSLL